jgi:hypothetical protein
MTLFALLAGLGLGSFTTLLLLRAGFRRWINGPEMDAFMRQQVSEAFHAGFMTAADIVTIFGQEELAGHLRIVANQTTPANDNR